MSFDSIETNTDTWMEKLEDLFGKMGGEYDRVSDGYAFNCQGCEDNCCLSRFYHHTLLEHLYLRKGLSTLTAEALRQVRDRAEEVVKINDHADIKGEHVKVMCPLNSDGRCILYHHRPMVCRLHGIAHELKRPGQPPVKGSGCDLFTELAQTVDYLPFDRTPFYIEMAQLEGELRKATGFTDRLKNTIARMILL